MFVEGIDEGGDGGILDEGVAGLGRGKDGRMGELVCMDELHCARVKVAYVFVCESERMYVCVRTRCMSVPGVRARRAPSQFDCTPICRHGA